MGRVKEGVLKSLFLFRQWWVHCCSSVVGLAYLSFPHCIAARPDVSAASSFNFHILPFALYDHHSGLALTSSSPLNSKRAQAASQGPSWVPSDTGMLDNTVLTRGSGASSSVSVAGLLGAVPAVTSTPPYLWSPGAHSESSAYGM